MAEKSTIARCLDEVYAERRDSVMVCLPATYSLVYVGHCAMGVSHIEASNDKLHPNRTHYTE